MSDLRAREASRDDWDGPVVELVEDEAVVAIVYQDGDTLLAEFVTAIDGDPWAFEVADLQTALDNARAMLLPEGAALLADEVSADDTHPVDRLAAEFDDEAVRRGPEDEGFFTVRVAAAILRRCESLGLAMVGLEGFRVAGESLTQVPSLTADPGRAHDGEPWPVFLAGSNVQAMAVLERWAHEPDLLVALEVGDDDGERYVL